MRIIFATHNKNKMIEIRQILADTAEEIVSKGELGISFEPEENGKSFSENRGAVPKLENQLKSR